MPYKCSCEGYYGFRAAEVKIFLVFCFYGLQVTHHLSHSIIKQAPPFTSMRAAYLFNFLNTKSSMFKYSYQYKNIKTIQA